MQFNSEANDQDIVSDILFRTGTTLNDYFINDITRNVNNHYGKICLLILMCNNRWRWDDPNHSYLQYFPINLVSGTANYTVIEAAPGTTEDWLIIDRVEVQDSAGNWTVLTPKDLKDVKQAWDEYQSSGTPVFFDFDGFSIILSPKPDYAQASGLRIYPVRNPLYFAPSATTKRPGFATPLHPALSIGASIDWCIKYDPGKVAALQREYITLVGDPINEIDGLLQRLYANRDRYENKKITRRGPRRI